MVIAANRPIPFLKDGTNQTLAPVLGTTSLSQIFSSSRCRLDITSVGASFTNSATIPSRPRALVFFSLFQALGQ